MAERIKAATEGPNLRLTTDLNLQEADRDRSIPTVDTKHQKSPPPDACYISFGPPKAPQATGKLSPSEILRQAKRLRDRLNNLQNSPSQTFKDFLKNFEPFQETKRLATIAYWNTNSENLVEIEESILSLEEYERLLIAGEKLGREFPQGLENDPTFQKILAEDPEWARQLNSAFHLMRGEILSVRPGTAPGKLFPAAYQGIYETLFQFANSGFKKFLDRASAEQGIDVHYEEFDFSFTLHNSCDPAPEPKKRSQSAPRRKEIRTEAAGEETPEIKSRQKIFETTARLIGARQLAKALESDNPPALSLADLGKIRVGLEEELSSLMRELPSFLTAEQSRKVKNDLNYWMRSLKDHYRFSLPRDFAGVPLDQKIALDPQTKELLMRISGEAARLEAFLLTQRLQKEKEEISGLGMEPSVRHRLNIKLSQLLKLGREGEPSSIPVLLSQIMTGIDRNTLRLSISRQIEAFSDPDGVIQRGYRDWKFLYGDYGPGMHPKYFEHAVSLLKQCEKHLAEGNAEEAQKLFGELSGSEFYKDLLAYLQAYQEQDVIRELAKGVAIVIIAGMTGGLVASTVAPYLEGSLLGKAVLALVEGTAFVVAEKALSGEISPTKILSGETPVGQLTAETLIDIAFAAPMLAYLKKVGKISKRVVEGLKQKGFEKALALSPRLAKRLKELGPEGKILEKIGEYLGDLVAFTAWEGVEGIGRQALDGEIDFERVAEQVFSWEGTYNRALFLGALKLGHYTASPAFQPIGGWVNNRTVQHHLKRLQAIQQETGEALRGLRVIGVKGTEDVEKLENDQLAILDPTFKRLLTLQKRKIAILSALEAVAPEGPQKNELRSAVAREREALQESKDFYKDARELRQRKEVKQRAGLQRWAERLIQRVRRLGDTSLLQEAEALRAGLREVLPAELGSVRKQLDIFTKKVEAVEREKANPGLSIRPDGWFDIARLTFLEQEGIIDRGIKEDCARYLSIPGIREQILSILSQLIVVRDETFQINSRTAVRAYTALGGLLFEFSRNESVSHVTNLPATAIPPKAPVKVRYYGLREKIVEIAEGGQKKELVREWLESEVQNDVPVVDGHIYETKWYHSKMSVGSDIRAINQALKYQKAIGEGHFEGATIEISGKIHPRYLDFIRQHCPDVEILYHLELPNGHEISFPIKKARDGRRSFARTPSLSELTSREQRIVEGIQRRLANGTIAEIFTGNLLTESDIEGNPYEQLLRGAFTGGRVDPGELEDSISAFKEQVRLTHEKRLRMLEESGPAESTTPAQTGRRPGRSSPTTQDLRKW